MLGVNYQSINCGVKKCKFNHRSELLDGKTNKVVEVYYTCEKDTVNIDSDGACKDKLIGPKKCRTCGKPTDSSFYTHSKCKII